MKRYNPVFVILAILMLSFSALSQETAMDFSHDECSGPTHHLFAELDAGKVVILEFVMLNCAPCIVGTKALENITSPYENSHPGRVLIYSFGFLNSYSCEQLQAWKENNAFSHPVFNNGEEQVAYYGGMGMPTIVVVGNNEHEVFFKSIGYTSAMDDDIKAAIDSALLYNPTGVGEVIPSDQFKVYPTVFSNQLHIETKADLAGADVLICDAFGREILASRIPASGQLVIEGARMAKGIYFLRLKDSHGVSESVKLIRQ